MRLVQPVGDQTIDAGGLLCRTSRAAQFDRLHGESSQVGQGGDLARVRRCARDGVEHAQHADRHAVRRGEPYACEEPGVRRADDQRVLAEARIDVGVWYHHGRAARQQGMGAERVLAGYFDGVEADPCLEPDPPFIDQRDETDRRGQQRCRGADQIVEAVFGRRVEDAILPQRCEPELLIDGGLDVCLHASRFPRLWIIRVGSRSGDMDRQSTVTGVYGMPAWPALVRCEDAASLRRCAGLSHLRRPPACRTQRVHAIHQR